MRIIAGTAKGMRLKTVSHPLLKPIDDRVKEALFNILTPVIEGAKVCDLFAGCGAIGFEALSRGAKEVLFVEKERKMLSVIEQNIDLLQVQDQAQTWSRDVLEGIPTLAHKGAKFNLVFVDPPYFDRVMEKQGGGWKQVLGERKPDPLSEGKSSSPEEAISLPQLVLKLLNQYPILKDQGVIVLRTFKKVALETQHLKNLQSIREQRYGDALLSFFSLKEEN